jgi:hypothetical protein
MGKKFIFTSPQHNFECLLARSQCGGLTVNGNGCKRNCISPFEYCFQHLESLKKLKVKKSNIPNAGLGLFAFDRKQPDNTVIFKKGDKIIGYEGQMIDANQKNLRYGNHTCPYCAGLNKNEIIDAGCKRGIGSHINTNRNNNLNNAKLVVDSRNKKINIKATKNISNKNEIFIPYGSSYRLNENEVRHTTAYTKN